MPHVCRYLYGPWDVKKCKVETISFPKVRHTSKSDIPSALWLHFKFGDFSRIWLFLASFEQCAQGGPCFAVLWPPWAFFGGGTYKCSVQIKIILERL